MTIIVRILLIVIVIALMMLLGRYVGEALFASYYEMEWGISARIVHSPPLGVNYINKLAIVIRWSLAISFILGLLMGIIITHCLGKRVRVKER